MFYPFRLGNNYRFININLIKEFTKTANGKVWILTNDFDREFDTLFDEFILAMEDFGNIRPTHVPEVLL
jgi:hypothetical protein